MHKSEEGFSFYPCFIDHIMLHTRTSCQSVFCEDPNRLLSRTKAGPLMYLTKYNKVTNVRVLALHCLKVAIREYQPHSKSKLSHPLSLKMSNILGISENKKN